MRQTNYRFSPTFTLVVVNIAVYIYTSFIGKNFIFTAGHVLQIYGQFNYAILYGGWWWQMITSIFVHVSLVHLASNMFFLLIFGLRAEDLFADSIYYFIYFASGLTGSLFSLVYLFYPNPVTAAGASGAIFGLFGAVIIYLKKVVGGSVIGALLFAFMFFLITLSEGTNIYAHFGGLLAGLVIGYWVARSRKDVFTDSASY